MVPHAKKKKKKKKNAATSKKKKKKKPKFTVAWNRGVRQNEENLK